MPRAVRFDDWGSVDVLYIADVPEPSAGRGEVVVRVVAAGTNPGEMAIREGILDNKDPSKVPSGQGSEFAGRIQAVGDGVNGWSVGDEVIGWSETRSAQADFVVVPNEQIVAKPPSVPWDQAGGLFVVAVTAYAATRAVHAQSGEIVAVSAAAGGVGSVVVQMLRNDDVRVLGIAGPDNDEWLRSIGVEPVHRGDGLGHRLRAAAPEGIDAFIDCFGDGYVELAVGLGIDPQRVETIIDYAAADKFGAKHDGSMDATSQGVLVEMAEMVSDDEVTIPIAATFPLDQVREAYTQLAGRRTHGKIVLVTGA